MERVDALVHGVGPRPLVVVGVVGAFGLVQLALALALARARALQHGACVHVLPRGLQLEELGAADALGIDGDVLGREGFGTEPVGALGQARHARVVVAVAIERRAAEGFAPRGRVVVARPVDRADAAQARVRVGHLGPPVRGCFARARTADGASIGRCSAIALDVAHGVCLLTHLVAVRVQRKKVGNVFRRHREPRAPLLARGLSRVIVWALVGTVLEPDARRRVIAQRFCFWDRHVEVCPIFAPDPLEAVAGAHDQFVGGF